MDLIEATLEAFVSYHLQRGNYTRIHAACVAIGELGVLIPGAPGAGKTTAALGFAQAGFDFLADDTVFISRSEHRITIHPLVTLFGVEEGTLNQFPKFGFLRTWNFEPQTFFPGDLERLVYPAVVVYPRVCPDQDSSISLLEDGMAREFLLQRVRAPDLIRIKQPSLDERRREFEIALDLASRVKSYSLSIGHDFGRKARDMVSSAIRTEISKFIVDSRDSARS